MYEDEDRELYGGEQEMLDSEGYGADEACYCGEDSCPHCADPGTGEDVLAWWWED